MEDQLKTTARTGDHLKSKSLIHKFSKYKVLQTVTESLWRMLSSKMTVNSKLTMNWLSIIWAIIMNSWLRWTKLWWKITWISSLLKRISLRAKKKKLWRSLICDNFMNFPILFQRARLDSWNSKTISRWANIFLIYGTKNIKLR